MAASQACRLALQVQVQGTQGSRAQHAEQGEEELVVAAGQHRPRQRSVRPGGGGVMMRLHPPEACPPRRGVGCPRGARCGLGCLPRRCWPTHSSNLPSVSAMATMPPRLPGPTSFKRNLRGGGGRAERRGSGCPTKRACSTHEGAAAAPAAHAHTCAWGSNTLGSGSCWALPQSPCRSRPSRSPAAAGRAGSRGRDAAAVAAAGSPQLAAAPMLTRTAAPTPQAPLRAARTKHT